MSIISGLINGLQHLFSHSAVQSQQLCAIRRTSLINIFQLLNPELFEISDDVPLDDEDIQIAATELALTGSRIAGHLTNPELTQIKLKSYACREDGASLLFLEYDHTPAKAPKESWATLILSTISVDDGKVQIIPHFTISEIYHSQGSHVNGLVFVPLDVTCLAHIDGEDQYYQPTEQAEFQGAIAYANQAFTQLIAGLPIDTLENQKWMETAKYHEAAKLCEKLILRTTQTFSGDVKAAVSSLPQTPQ